MAEPSRNIKDKIQVGKRKKKKGGKEEKTI
jgi:hypothetical protein